MLCGISAGLFLEWHSVVKEQVHQGHTHTHTGTLGHTHGTYATHKTSKFSHHSQKSSWKCPQDSSYRWKTYWMYLFIFIEFIGVTLVNCIGFKGYRLTKFWFSLRSPKIIGKYYSHFFRKKRGNLGILVPNLWESVWLTGSTGPAEPVCSFRPVMNHHLPQACEERSL